MSDDWVIALRWLLYVDLGVLFGLPLFAIYALGRDREDMSYLPIAPVLVVLGIVGVAASAFGFLLQASAMAATPLTQLDGKLLLSLLDGTPLGSALKVRAGALLIALVSAAVMRRLAGATSALTLSSGAALATLAWSGHGAAGNGAIGSLQVAGDILHLLAAGAWVGAIVAFAILLSGPIKAGETDRARLAHRALDSFGIVGTVFVGVLVTTGLLNTTLLVGFDHLGAAMMSRYGLLLCAKLILFGVMLSLAALNRFRLTPKLGGAIDVDSPDTAMRDLRKSIFVEGAIATLILGLVAWLGTLAPPISG